MPEIPEPIEKIHIVGIVGTAMGSLAAMLKAKGFEVRGSDAGAYPPMSDWLDERHIPYTVGYRPENLDWNPDLVIIGNVVRSSYADAEEAVRRKLPTISLPEALKHFFFEESKNLVITGTHGKTTTSSMLAWILFATQRDPSFFIGGVTGNFDSNYRLGKSPLYVIEGDEYDTAYFDKVPKFWHYRPYYATINNIEYDHADIYPTLEDILYVFKRFAELLPKDGTLWINGDDQKCHEVSNQIVAKRKTFGLSSKNDLYAKNIEYHKETTEFDLIYNQTHLGQISIPMIGSFNVRNALGAIGIALELNIPYNEIQNALKDFKTTKKRQQLIAEINGISIYDDFAHHPSAVAQTISAFRTKFPGRRIVVAFEAKSNTSHRAIFQEEYAQALSLADYVILAKAWKKK